MEYIKIIFSALGTGLIYVLGGWDVAIQCLLVAIVIDYITGLLKGFKKGKLSSSVGLKGIIKKVGILCLVALSVIVDRLVGETGLIRNTVIYYLTANEGLSIIENLGEMNVLVPKILKEKLEQLKEKEGE